MVRKAVGIYGTDRHTTVDVRRQQEQEAPYDAGSPLVRKTPDMSVHPEVGSMIPEDLSTKYSIGSMIQSDPTIKFDSRSWIQLDPSVIWDWISDPIGSLMELVVSDL